MCSLELLENVRDDYFLVQTIVCSLRLRAEEEQRRQQEARERQERAARQAEEERVRREEERRNREEEERRQKEQRWKDMQDQLDREVIQNSKSFLMSFNFIFHFCNNKTQLLNIFNKKQQTHI